MLDDDGHVLKLLEAKSHKECLEEVLYEHVYKKEPRNEEWRTLKNFLPFYFGKVNLTHLGKNCILLNIFNKVFSIGIIFFQILFSIYSNKSFILITVLSC